MTFENHCKLKLNTYDPLSNTVIFRTGGEENLPRQNHGATVSARKPSSEVAKLLLLIGLLYLKLIFFTYVM